MELRDVLAIFPGVSCAYMDAKGHVTAEQYGSADRERCVPVDENTIFPACSISKFVTAIGLMKLQEQGLIDIDRPVNAYLHRWKLRSLGGHESSATIREIMCHTAGIVDGEVGFYGLRQSDAEISLLDILEGVTSYNNHPARAEKEPGTAFEYSDAGYCVLQLLMEETTGKVFDEAARMLVFDALGLQYTFFASRKNVAEHARGMAAGYDGDGAPLPGKFPYQPDLAASALWSTPKELLVIAKEFAAAYQGQSAILTAESAREMAAPVEKFPWTGLGVFRRGADTLLSQGWGENGQCMLKINCRTGEIAAVMTNRNPEVDQAESGVEWLTDRYARFV